MAPFPFQTSVTMAMSRQRRLHLAVNWKCSEWGPCFVHISPCFAHISEALALYILALSSPSSPSISVSLCKFVPCVVTFALCSYFLGRCIKSSSASSSSSSASASSSSSSASASYRPRHPRRPHRRDEHHHHHHDRRYQHPIIIAISIIINAFVVFWRKSLSIIISSAS